jgi:hypothetical protein
MAPPFLDNGENEDGAQGEDKAGGEAVHRGSLEEFFSRWQDRRREKIVGDHGPNSQAE